MLEIKTNLFVGNIDKRRSEEFWAFLEKSSDTNSEAVMVFQDERSPAGFDVQTLGQGRRIVLDNFGIPVSLYRNRILISPHGGDPS